MSWKEIKELLEYTYKCFKDCSISSEDYYLGMINAFEIIAFHEHPREFHEWNMKRVNNILRQFKEVN